MRSVHDTGDAVVVLQGGEPAAVLIGATEFAALREHRRFLAAIGEGLADNGVRAASLGEGDADDVGR